MKKNRSLLFKIIFTIVSSGIFLACQENRSEEKNLPPPLFEKPVTPPSPPSIEDDENGIYRWHYKGGVDSFSSDVVPAECPADFVVDGTCDSALTLCKKKISLYGCYPENLEIRITGKVLDENNQPIENVKINGSLGVPGYDEIGETYTKKSGKFILKIQNFCVRIVVAFKDGYVSSSGKNNATTLTYCEVENFVGAKDLILHLKKAPRTSQNVDVKSEEQFCRIVGKVFNNDGSGLPEVTITNGKQSVLSDNDGNYVIEKKEKCDNHCTLSKQNYSSVFPEKSDSAVVSCFLGQPNDVVFESK